jgi:HSP20 family protein
MQESAKIQYIPVKMYRSEDRLMIAAPMPGLQPEDIIAQVTEQGLLVLQGELRGVLKDIKELLMDEWSVGGYYRELELPNYVDGTHANMNYGNGVLVITLPLAEQMYPAILQMDKVGIDRGSRSGNAGHAFQI